MCGENGGFDCLDPDYYSYYFEDDFPQQSSDSYDGASCEHERIGNAFCDGQNNNPECGVLKGNLGLYGLLLETRSRATVHTAVWSIRCLIFTWCMITGNRYGWLGFHP